MQDEEKHFNMDGGLAEATMQPYPAQWISYLGTAEGLGSFN